MILMRATLATERGPHGKGNLYAPEVRREGGLYRMWYGAQGRDGHDRIHLAVSRDGLKWARRGVVVDRGRANHVNDPSVVKVGPRYLMYYTLARRGIADEIALAVSRDGLRWTPQGTVIGPDDIHPMLVGRPSVVADGLYRMWYDGRRDMDGRSVAYATSTDGRGWTKHGLVSGLDPSAGAVDVERVGNAYLMAYESGRGTCLASSGDGIEWTDLGLRWPCSGSEFGHVTPMLFADRGRVESVYVGVATGPDWDRNVIGKVDFEST